MLLNKQQVKDVDDLPRKIINVEEWGGEIEIQKMNARRRMEYEKAAQNVKLPMDNIICLVLFSCINEDGSLMFSLEDRDDLLGKSSDSLIKLFQASVDLNEMSNKALEEKAKN
jgi:hypothetical protein